ALVQALKNPTLNAYYDKVVDLALRHLPLVISFIGLALQLFIGNIAARRREARLAQQQAQAQRAR
ncbi:hypothetical protein JCM8547_008431, partial [Rhodosporidiobolus lusitaniae]